MICTLKNSLLSEILTDLLTVWFITNSISVAMIQAGLHVKIEVFHFGKRACSCSIVKWHDYLHNQDNNRDFQILSGFPETNNDFMTTNLLSKLHFFVWMLLYF